jgi:hypothetical protein
MDGRQENIEWMDDKKGWIDFDVEHHFLLDFVMALHTSIFSFQVSFLVGPTHFHHSWTTHWNVKYSSWHFTHMNDHLLALLHGTCTLNWHFYCNKMTKLQGEFTPFSTTKSDVKQWQNTLYTLAECRRINDTLLLKSHSKDDNVLIHGMFIHWHTQVKPSVDFAKIRKLAPVQAVMRNYMLTLKVIGTHVKKMLQVQFCLAGNGTFISINSLF